LGELGREKSFSILVEVVLKSRNVKNENFFIQFFFTRGFFVFKNQEEYTMNSF
jgi:hypothetical protein